MPHSETRIRIERSTHPGLNRICSKIACFFVAPAQIEVYELPPLCNHQQDKKFGTENRCGNAFGFRQK